MLANEARASRTSYIRLERDKRVVRDALHNSRAGTGTFLPGSLGKWWAKSQRDPPQQWRDNSWLVLNVFPTCNVLAAYWPRGDSAASSLFGGMPGGYGLGAHHLPSAYAILGRGGSGPGGFGGHGSAAGPPPPPYSHGGLGSLSVAASQAASLGMNSASAAWWTMATHLATQDYLARLQGAAAGLPAFPPGAESLLPPYPPALLNAPSHSSHKSSKCEYYAPRSVSHRPSHPS